MLPFQGPSGVKVSSLSCGFLVYFKRTEPLLMFLLIPVIFLRRNVKMSDATKVPKNTE